MAAPTGPPPGTPPGPPPAAPPARRRFGPDRIALIPVVVFFFGTLPIATSSAWLLWLVLLPLASAVWVVRARVVAAPVGIAVCNGLGTTRLPWSEVEGFEVRRWAPVRLLRNGARPLPLTALPRRDLPRLVEIAEQTG